MGEEESKWYDLFDERQQQEIKFSIVYADGFKHGTDGHNAKLIIAKFADFLTRLENAGVDLSMLE